MLGTFYGVGVGSGDPGLITVKGLGVLTSVPVIYVPKSRDESGSFALSIIEEYVDRSRQEVIDLIFPMCKDTSGLASFWDNSVGLILERLRNGLDVAAICIGDPLLYSTFSFLLDRTLEKEPSLNVQIIPGVTSISACAAALRLPLVQAGERLAVIPATYHEKAIREALEEYDAVVLMKVNRVMDQVLTLLGELGLTDHAFFVSRCGTDRQEIIRDVERLRGQHLDYHSLMIVRKQGSLKPGK